MKFSTPTAKRKSAASPWPLVEFLKWDQFKLTLHRGAVSRRSKHQTDPGTAEEVLQLLS